jgi:hypothetical protein
MKRAIGITAFFLSAIVPVVAANSDSGKVFIRPASDAWPYLQCHYTMYVVAAEVGRQCRVGRDQEFQAELKRTVARFEAVIRAGNTYFTTEQLNGFKAMQIGGPAPIKCNEKALDLYEALHKRGTDRLRMAVDKVLTPPKGGWSKARYCLYDVVPAIPLEHVKPQH